MENKFKMTEEEACVKVCPFQGNMVDAFCRPESCMAWVNTSKKRKESEEWSRWKSKYLKVLQNYDIQFAREHFGTMPSSEIVDEWKINYLQKNPEPIRYADKSWEPEGYCGRLYDGK